MKPITFENIITHERFVCDNVNFVRHFDGVAYLSVHRVGSTRNVLMRKDVLVEVVDI